MCHVPSPSAGCRTGNGGKISNSFVIFDQMGPSRQITVTLKLHLSSALLRRSVSVRYNVRSLVVCGGGEEK